MFAAGMNWRRRFLRYWFLPAPAERLAALRILIGGFAAIYVWVRIGYLLAPLSYPAASFAPVGVVGVLPAPLPELGLYVALGVTLTSSLAFWAGACFRVTGPLFALSLLWILSYRNSWGMIFHTENLLVLHVLVLGLSPASDAWSWDRRRLAREPDSQRVDCGQYGWPIRAMTWIVVIGYVLAGVAKLKHQGWAWADGEVLRGHVAYDAVRKLELGSIASPLAGPVVSQTWLFPPLSWFTLAFELGAPLALLGGRLARWWCVSAWCFHVGVLAMMAIVFPYPLSGCAFLPFFAVERSEWLRRAATLPPLKWIAH